LKVYSKPLVSDGKKTVLREKGLPRLRGCRINCNCGQRSITAKTTNTNGGMNDHQATILGGKEKRESYRVTRAIRDTQTAVVESVKIPTSRENRNTAKTKSKWKKSRERRSTSVLSPKANGHAMTGENRRNRGRYLTGRGKAGY